MNRLAPTRSEGRSRRLRRVVMGVILATTLGIAAPAAATPLTVATTAQDLNGGQVNPTDVLRYTIVVTNPTSPAAPGTVVTDVIPSGLTYVGGSLVKDGVPMGDSALDGDSAAFVAGVATFDVGTLNANGGTTTLTLDVTVDPAVADGTQIVNTARATYGAAADEGSVTVTVVAPPPALTVTKTVQDLNGGAVQPGDVLRYVVSASNTSTAATNAVISDTLPAGVTYVPGSLVADGTSLTDVADADAGQVAGRTVTTGAGPANVLARGATRIVTFDARVDPDVIDGAVVVNTASLHSTFAGIASTAVSPPAPVTIGAPPALTVATQVADVNGGLVSRGDVLVYTVTVSSTGVGYARNVTLTDPIPAGATYVTGSATIDGGAVTDAAGDDPVDVSALGVTARLGTLVPGAIRTLTFRVRVGDTAADGTIVSNTASAVFGGLAGGATGSVTSPPAVVAVTVPPPPALAVTERYQLVFDADNDGAIGPGDLVQYTVIVANRGGSAAAGVTHTVQLPSVVEFIPRSLITTRGTATFLPPSMIVGRIGTLGAGESASFAWVVRLGAGATSLAQLVTGSSVSAGTTPGGGAGGTVARAPRLRVTVRGPRQLRGGEVGTFRIVIRNLSGRDVRNLTLVAVMPPGLVAVSSAPRYRLMIRRPVWQIGVVRAGSSVALVMRLRATTTARGVRVNSVVVSGPTIPTVTLRTPVNVVAAARAIRQPAILG